MKRRRRIIERLEEADAPVTGTELARELGVSRQAVVQDVALLRAEGHEVLATPQGYVIAPEVDSAAVPHRARIAVDHPPERTEEELNTFVDCGVRVVDVIVEHALYGDLTGALMLSTREDVRRFIRQLSEMDAPLLSSLSDGVHLHTVEFDKVEDFKRAEGILRSKGLLAGQ